jgi:integrase
MRYSEIINLTWQDINLEKQFLILHETKNGERRNVPLAGHALELIKALGKVRRLDTPLLFPGNASQKPTTMRRHWKKALSTAEIENFRFHDLRHSAASYLAMNGATTVDIAGVLGHKTLAMVKRYSHLSEQHTSKVVAAMNEKIFGV